MCWCVELLNIIYTNINILLDAVCSYSMIIKCCLITSLQNIQELVQLNTFWGTCSVSHLQVSTGFFLCFWCIIAYWHVTVHLVLLMCSSCKTKEISGSGYYHWSILLVEDGETIKLASVCQNLNIKMIIASIYVADDVMCVFVSDIHIKKVMHIRTWS